MENILTFLDTAQLYDDENETINKKEIEKTVNKLESDVNCFGFNPEKIYADFHAFIDESGVGKNLSDPTTAYRYAENRLFMLALQWINFWGNAEPHKVYGGFYACIDGRNEIAVKRCNEICQQDSFRKMYDFYTVPVDFESYNGDYLENTYRYFIEKTNTMHKTNMQTATQLMIYAVTNSSIEDSKKLKEYLADKYGEKYYRMPLI